MTTSSVAVRQLSDANSQGTTLGQSSTDKISFYNVTPVPLNTSAFGLQNQSTVVVASSSNAYGFTLATASTLIMISQRLFSTGIYV